jgi:hypothetical protein
MGMDSDMTSLVKDMSTDASTADEDDDLRPAVPQRLGRTGSIKPMTFASPSAAAATAAAAPAAELHPLPPRPPGPSPVRPAVPSVRASSAVPRLDTDSDRPAWAPGSRSDDSVNSASGAVMAKMFAARRIGGTGGGR